jgi:hypothetical protein
MKRLLLLVTAALLCAAPAWADLTMKMSFGSPDSKVRSKGTTYATADKLAMLWEPGGEMKAGSHMVFDANKQTMWVIDDEEKSYMALDKATMEQMGQQMEAGMAKMKEMLAQMPPEQRAMMEKKMGGMMGGPAKPPEQKYIKTAETKTINGFPCTRYDVRSTEKLSGRLWVTPYSQVKITPADMTVFLKMAEFFKAMAGPLMKNFQGADNPFASTNQVDGMPILNELVEKDGKVKRDVLVEAINHDKAPAGVFDVPTGYKQKEMPKPGKPD